MRTPAAATSPGFIVAGTHSGAGKTTITLALLRALSVRGLRIQSFKIGPDFIDPGYHSEVTGLPSINLDLWMMGTENSRRTFRRFGRGPDMVLIESMGGLYDGEGGTERGSAAAFSKLLDVPIILVIDIWGMTRSATALLEGFIRFGPQLTITGFVMNRAGSPRHAEMVLQAMPGQLRELSLGFVLQRDSLAIPERHLGLVTRDENRTSTQDRLAALDAAGAFLRIERVVPPSEPERRRPARPARPVRKDRVRIAIAKDRAFCFYYAENLEALEKAGAELCPFLPTSDAHLPMDIAGVYIGGGYPESFASELATNASLNEQLLQCASVGMPIYAECGGFMYLGRTLIGFTGLATPMVGIFPIDTIMDPHHLAIRYVTVHTLVDSPLGPVGTEARGQEFHQSRVHSGIAHPLYKVEASSGEEYEAGAHSASALGSYIHLHFASNPDIPRNFVASCRAWQQREVSP